MKALRWFAITTTFAMSSLMGCERDRVDDRPGMESPRVDDTRMSDERVRTTDEPARETERAAESDRPTRTVSAVDKGAAASAAQSIAQARCARESRCNNIGENKKYSSQNDCIQRVQTDWKDDLNARECPGGVVQSELNECLAEIRNEDCGNPLDTLGRIAACRESDICKGTPEVNTR